LAGYGRGRLARIRADCKGPSIPVDGSVAAVHVVQTMNAIKIHVMAACKHERCALRWFNCHITHGTAIVATYECADDNGAGEPTDRDIAHVTTAHPGCSLVY
jgi:hypothetical protein